MFKSKIYNKLKDALGDFLFGFDEDQLDVGMFGGNIELKDLIIKPKKVNEILEEQNLPFALKAGLIAKVQIQVKKFSRFLQNS